MPPLHLIHHLSRDIPHIRFDSTINKFQAEAPNALNLDAELIFMARDLDYPWAGVLKKSRGPILWTRRLTEFQETSGNDLRTAFRDFSLNFRGS